MQDSAVTVRAIDWRGVFPAFFLIRAMRIAFRPSLIGIGAVGIALSCCGWWLGEQLFLGKTEHRLRAEVNLLESPLHSAAIGGVELEVVGLSLGGATHGGVVESFANRFVVPAIRFFRPGITLKETAFLVFGLLWQLAVWGLAGGVITRQAIIELATDEQPSLKESWDFVMQRFLFYIGAPLFPVLGVLLLSLPLLLLGFIMRADVGIFVAGIVWVLVAVVGLIAAWLLVGLALGWPLLWGAVSAEPDGDHFGAMSRMYSYVYQRPLNYLLYLVFVVLIGLFAGWLITTFAETALNVSHWGVTWGMDAKQAADFASATNPGRQPSRTGGSFGMGISMIRCVEHGVRSLAAGLGATFFWCSFAGIYLLLRKDVDDKELDDIVLPYDTMRPDPVAAVPVTAPPVAPATPAASAAPMRFEPSGKPGVSQPESNADNPELPLEE